jgi:hypothetical protein
MFEHELDTAQKPVIPVFTALSANLTDQGLEYQ